MAYAQVVNITCPTCERVGQHQIDCRERMWFPPKCVTDRDAVIMSVTLDDGRVLANECTSQRLTFEHSDLATFTMGRTLIEQPNGHVWARFNPTFELRFLQTTNQTGAGPHGGTSSEGHSNSTRTNLPSLTAHTPRSPSSASGRSYEVNQGVQRENTGRASPVDAANDLDSVHTSRADPGLEIAKSLMRSHESANLIAQLKRFNGEPSNFPAWIRQVRNLRPLAFDSVSFFHTVISKLGEKPATFIEGAGDLGNDLDKLIDVLTREYHAWGDKSYALEELLDIKQKPEQSVTDLNSLFLSVAKAAGYTADTNDNILRQKYVKAFEDEEMRILLTRKRKEQPELKLRELMKIAVEEERILRTARGGRFNVNRATQSSTDKVGTDPVVKTEKKSTNASTVISPAESAVATELSVLRAQHSATQADLQKQLTLQSQREAAHASLSSQLSLQNQQNQIANEVARQLASRQPVTYAAGVPTSSKPPTGFQSRRPQVDPPVRPNDCESWCDIHEVTGHSTQECRQLMSTTCPFCTEEMTPGTLGDHVKGNHCSAFRCLICHHLGHIARYCRMNERSGWKGGSDRGNRGRGFGRGSGRGFGRGYQGAYGSRGYNNGRFDNGSRFDYRSDSRARYGDRKRSYQPDEARLLPHLTGGETTGNPGQFESTTKLAGVDLTQATQTQ